MKDWSVEDIGNHLETILKAKLIEAFETEGDKFYHITNFAQHQTLKRDRKPQTIDKNLGDWKTIDSIWKPKEVSKEEKEVIEVNKEGYKKFLDAKKLIGKI